MQTIFSAENPSSKLVPKNRIQMEDMTRETALS